MVFKEFALSEAVLRGIESVGFNQPTPVQEQALGPALQGRDLIVFAETGTGRTVSYALPILERLARQLRVEAVGKDGGAPGVASAAGEATPAQAPAEPGASEGTKDSESSPPEPKDAGESASSGEAIVAPAAGETGVASAAAPPVPPSSLQADRPMLTALILGPTRESVTRAESTLRALGQHLPVRIRAIFGGVPAAPQREAIRRGLHVIAATPGRLSEIFRRQDVPLDKVQILVLDELDHLAQMNLVTDLRAITDRIPPTRQTLVFAAKRTVELDALASTFVRDPVAVQIEGAEVPLAQIHQAYYIVDHLQKNEMLLELFRRLQPAKCVVFFRTRRSVDRLHPLLEQMGMRVSVLHADRTPAQRQGALQSFATGESNTLLATEMAVRSLEVEGITHLINFDLPQFPDDYMNRIVRCSQINPVRDVLSLVCAEDRDALRRLEKAVGPNLERAELEGFVLSARRDRRAGGEGMADSASAESYGPRRGRRPMRPVPPFPEEAVAGVAGSPHNGASSGVRNGSAGEFRPQTAPDTPKGESNGHNGQPSGAAAAAPSAAAPAPSGLASVSRQRIHPSERLSGRLTRPDAPAGASASVPAAPSAAPVSATPSLRPSQNAPAPASAAPSAASARAVSHGSKAPHGGEIRPGPFERRASREPLLPPPPPVSAAPVLPPESEETPQKQTLSGFSVTSFSKPQAEEGPPPQHSRRGRPRGRAGQRPDWMDSVEENKAAESKAALSRPPLGEKSEDRDNEESEQTDRGGSSTAKGRGGRDGYERRPRRIRSWDLHRGGLLDPPPLLSTPFPSFLAEERQARKQESAELADRENSFASAGETRPGAAAQLAEIPSVELPMLDWDHPMNPYPSGRPSGLTLAWQQRMKGLETARSLANGEVAGRADSARVPAAGARPASGGVGAAPVRPGVQPAAAAAPFVPAYPVALGSGTTIGMAPGSWIAPPPPELSSTEPAAPPATEAKAAEMPVAKGTVPQVPPPQTERAAPDQGLASGQQQVRGASSRRGRRGRRSFQPQSSGGSYQSTAPPSGSRAETAPANAASNAGEKPAARSPEAGIRRRGRPRKTDSNASAESARAAAAPRPVAPKPAAPPVLPLADDPGALAAPRRKRGRPPRTAPPASSASSPDPQTGPADSDARDGRGAKRSAADAKGSPSERQERSSRSKRSESSSFSPSAPATPLTRGRKKAAADGSGQCGDSANDNKESRKGSRPRGRRKAAQ